MYKKKLQVEAIQFGTVIDHIPESIGIKILNLFKLNLIEEKITIGLNLPSNKNGKKDLIKIENFFFNDKKSNQLAIYAPHATINNIENYKVISKKSLTMPKFINGILNCLNTNCISNIELTKSIFAIKSIDKKIYLQCNFCENFFEKNIII